MEKLSTVTVDSELHREITHALLSIDLDDDLEPGRQLVKDPAFRWLEHHALRFVLRLGATTVVLMLFLLDVPLVVKLVGIGVVPVATEYVCRGLLGGRGHAWYWWVVLYLLFAVVTYVVSS